MNAKVTNHAEDRLTHRLQTLVTKEEVLSAIALHFAKVQRIPAGERALVVVKTVPYTEIADADVKPDGIARGDQVSAAVLWDGCKAVVTTVMLRKSWSKGTGANNRTVFMLRVNDEVEFRNPTEEEEGLTFVVVKVQGQMTWVAPSIAEPTIENTRPVSADELVVVDFD